MLIRKVHTMNIGIDIDGVLIDFESFSTNYGSKMCIDEGWKLEIDIQQYWENKKYNWSKEQEEKFWNKYLAHYVENSEVRKFAPEIIEKLKKQGDNIYIITARNEDGLPKEKYGQMQDMTKKWLDKNNIKYDKIIFSSDNEKVNECIKNNIDIMIEDSPKNILSIALKKPVIKYECIYNQNITGPNIITAYSWYQIYDIIEKIKGEK